jgi:hypothetical protein
MRAGDQELQETNVLARERADAFLYRSDESTIEDEPLRARLRELDVISPYAFVPDERQWRRRM